MTIEASIKGKPQQLQTNCGGLVSVSSGHVRLFSGYATDCNSA
jgi:hypothetical protein